MTILLVMGSYARVLCADDNDTLLCGWNSLSTGAVRRGRGGKGEEWTDCVQSDIRAFGITGDWETMAIKAEVWVEAVTKGGRRFMAAWRQEEEDAARHRQEKREATRLGKLQSHTEA